METAITAIVTVLLVMAMLTDLCSSRIPNWLTFPAIGVGMAVHAWTSGFPGVLFSLAGLGVGFGLFLILHICKAIGAGDVKLMAAIGSMVGPHGVLLCGLLAMIVGGLYALGAMFYQWGVAGAGRKLASAAIGSFLTGGKAWGDELRLPFRLRYGLAVGGGTLLFLLGLHPFGE